MSAATINIDQSSDSQLIITLAGRLAIETLSPIWKQSMQAITQAKPESLQIEASGLDYCDSAGITLLLTLKEKLGEKAFELKGLKPQFEKLLKTIEAIEVKQVAPTPPLTFIHHVGKVSLEMLQVLRLNLTYLGEVTVEVGKACMRPDRIRWRDVWYCIEMTGPNSFFILALLGFIIGLILSFQSAIPLARFGGTSFIPNIVGIGLTREMGPLIAAIILGGRTASSFAAEIGTMKVNQEIDALRTMGLSPLLFLAIPRIIAVMLMAPIMDLFIIFFGLLGSLVFMESIHYTHAIFFSQLESAVTLSDLFTGLFKTTVFGMVIAGIGCMHGLRTQFGASSVGISTTKAVVGSIIMMVLLDGIFAVLFYAIGI